MDFIVQALSWASRHQNDQWIKCQQGHLTFPGKSAQQIALLRALRDKVANMRAMPPTLLHTQLTPAELQIVLVYLKEFIQECDVEDVTAVLRLYMQIAGEK